MQAVSATTSGIRFIPLALPEIVAIVASGALVDKVGYYVSGMLNQLTLENKKPYV